MSDFSLDNPNHLIILAHEVFHCVQFDYSDATEVLWIAEGQAPWAAATCIEERIWPV